MGIKSTSQGWPLATDLAVGDALPTIGSAARQELQDVLNSTDSALEKLFADKNTLLADGGTISYSSGSLTLSATFKLHLNSTAGTTPVTKTISGTSFTFDATGKMLYVVLDNRTADSTLSGGSVVSNSATLPDPTSTTQDVVLIAKRIGTDLYFRNGVIFADGTTATMASSGGGSGSGEINVIANSKDATNWAATGTATVATTTTAGDLPLGGVLSTAIQISSGSTFDYVRYRWTMPASLKNKKLKLEWHQRPSGYTAGQFKVRVYKNSQSDYLGSYTEFSLSTHVSGISSIPAGDGKYTTTFDGDDADYYELRIERVSGSSTLNITNVIVGPGIQPQGAVVGPWTSYSPTMVGFGTTTTNLFQWRRNGSSMEIQALFTTGTPTATVAQMPLPTGYTIDSSIMGASNNFVVGTYDVHSQSTQTSVLARGGRTYLTFGNTNLSDSNGSDISTVSTNVGVFASVPIAEWAGSGTINTAQNDVEYLTNTNTSTGASDTTSFGYGSGGVAFVAVSSAGSTIKKRVRCQRPLGANAGKPVLEVSPDGILWMPAESQFPYMEASTERYGMRLVAGGTALTDIDVEFGGDGATGTDLWSAFTSWFWRVTVQQPGVAVGFGLADATSSGLMSASSQTLGGAKTWNDVQTFKATGGSLTAGSYSTAGAWTLGASGAGPAAYHTMHAGNGFGLAVKSPSTAPTSAYLSVWGSQSADASIGGIEFINQNGGTLALGYITMERSGANNSGTMKFETRNAGVGVAAGAISKDGAWILGPSTGGNTHTIRAGGGATVIAIQASDVGQNSVKLQMATNGTTVRSEWIASTADLFRVNTSAGTEHFNISSSGALGAGQNATNVRHTIRNDSITTDTLSVRNITANTGSDGLYAILCSKGSTTNTAGTNRFIGFTINGESTGSGYIGSNGANAAAFFNTSDQRLKKDVTDLTGSLNKIMDIRPVSYKWKADDSAAVGFLAQELVEVLPQMVVATDNGLGTEVPEGILPWSMTESGFIPYLVAALQELKAEKDALEARIVVLENA